MYDVKKGFTRLLLILGVVAVVWGGGMIVYRMVDARKSADTFLSIGDQVKRLISEQESQAAVGGDQTYSAENDVEAGAGDMRTAANEVSDSSAPTASPDVTPTAEQAGGQESFEQEPTEQPLPAEILAYRKLSEQYPDFVGWLRIEGTNIDYPVMRSPDEPERYLHRDFYGQRSYPGTPFMLPSSDPAKPSDNLTIYAHHMKDGTMFGGLTLYEKEEGYSEQPVIEFDSLYRTGRYVIFAVFRTSLDGGDQFKYYNYSDFADEAQFQEFVQMAQERSLYDTGIEVKYGDALLTLSTCDYHESDGRLVVMARQIE